jgi:phosphate transport system substrate-binding protein
MTHKLYTLLSIAVLASFSLTACGSTAASESSPAAASQDLSGTISISGAFALYPMMTVWASEFQKIHPNVQFDVQAGGSGKGMTDTLAGAVDIGMVSRAIKPTEEANGAYWVTIAKDGVFPVISDKNPILNDILGKGITQDTFKKIFITGEIKTWGEAVGKPEITDEIHIYTRSDSAGSADTWAQFCGGKAQADILATAIGVNGEPALVATVAKDPLGITYSNLGGVFDLTSNNLVQGTIVPPIDINGNGQADPEEYYKTKTDAASAIASGKYPFPPARFENLVTKGKPTGLTQAFIEWILTDGQQYLDQAGYVSLTPAEQTVSLAKVK